jgi:hypothetical protein
MPSPPIKATVALFLIGLDRVFLAFGSKPKRTSSMPSEADFFGATFAVSRQKNGNNRHFFEFFPIAWAGVLS